MPAKPILVIYNPAAGKGSAGKNLPQIEALLRARWIDYELVLTQGEGHALILSRQAGGAGYDVVVAAGGDGTVNECINGLMQFQPNGQARPALGVLPIGRGNDFAFGAGIPGELKAACDALARGKRRTIDLGRVHVDEHPEGRYFGNGIGLGFDAVVGFEASRIQWLHGAASYLAAVVRTIFLYARAPVYEIVFDGQTQRRPFLMISIMNGRRMGGAFMMAPDSQHGDGLFNLCLAGSVSQAKILGVALLFIQGKQQSHPEIQMKQARRVSIRAVDGAIPAHADGETLCTQGRLLEVELCPGALEVIFGGEPS